MATMSTGLPTPLSVSMLAFLSPRMPAHMLTHTCAHGRPHTHTPLIPRGTPTLALQNPHPCQRVRVLAGKGMGRNIEPGGYPCQFVLPLSALPSTPPSRPLHDLPPTTTALELPSCPPLPPCCHHPLGKSFPVQWWVVSHVGGSPCQFPPNCLLRRRLPGVHDHQPQGHWAFPINGLQVHHVALLRRLPELLSRNVRARSPTL